MVRVPPLCSSMKLWFSRCSRPQAAPKPDAEALHPQGHEAAKAQDHKKAAGLWQAAADLSHAGSLCCLGALYRDGRGVEKDDKRAVQLFEAAAGKGSHDAVACLALMHELGRGVVIDPKKA